MSLPTGGVGVNAAAAAAAGTGSLPAGPNGASAAAPLLAPLLVGLPPLTGLPPEARKVTQYLPPALLPLLGAPLESPAFASLLLPTVYAIDELGRTEWFARSRCRLLADPVASVGYKAVHSVTGLRRPRELTADVLREGPLVAPPPHPTDAAAPSPPRRLLDMATVRVLFTRKAKRMRGVMLPGRNWEATRGLEERARLVECAVTDEVFMLVRRAARGQAGRAAQSRQMVIRTDARAFSLGCTLHYARCPVPMLLAAVQNPVPLKTRPDYLTRLPRRPLALVDLHKAVTLANSAWRVRGCSTVLTRT
jgi:hypothetical protein